MTEYEDREFLAEMLLRDLGCTDEDLEGMWEENGPLEDDLDDFLREIYQDTGYDDQDLEGMLEEWEEDDAETDN